MEHGVTVQSCVIASSKRDFGDTGGVIPEYAARKQVECVLPVIEKALKDADVTPADLDGIAVTTCPGLLGSLLVGTTTARTLGALWKLPVIPVHHTLGHLSSSWLSAADAPQFPILTLSVSGGHTDVWYRTSHLTGKRVGATVDDAAGEAFDKGAVLLGLGYPGGPQLAALAKSGNERAHKFPVPMHDSDDFSFSGLKTSLKYLLRDSKQPLTPQYKADIAASYEFAICTHLLTQLERSLKAHPDIREVHIVGGVSANERLRAMAALLCKKYSKTLRTPSKLVYCTDNGAMIAAAGEFLLLEDASWAGRPFLTAPTASLAGLLRS